MMLVYPPIGLTADISGDKVLEIVIEEPEMFYRIADDIYSQVNGKPGEVVISENYVPIQLSKEADIITQFVPFTLNRKDILSHIYGRLKEKSVNEQFYNSTQELYAYIEKYLYDLAEDEDVEMDICRPEDIAAVLKAFELHIVETDRKLVERSFEYILASREYKKRSVFVTVGLRNYIKDSEAEDLFQSVLLNGITLICLEDKASARLKNESRIIIDKDLCII